MDNIPRYPDGWQDDHAGLPIHPNFPRRFNYTGLNAAWNRQGRSVDFSAQMALFADNLRDDRAACSARPADMPGLAQVHADIGEAVNQRCWSEADGFYYDLGYGEQIRRKHIGMFWVMLAGIAPPDRLSRMLGHLVDPDQFWRRIPGRQLAGGPGRLLSRRQLLDGQRLGADQLHDHPRARAMRPTGLGDPSGAAILLVAGPGVQMDRTFWENYAPGRRRQGQHRPAGLLRLDRPGPDRHLPRVHRRGVMP